MANSKAGNSIGQHVYTAEDLDKLTKLMSEKIIPMAVDLKLVDGDYGFASITQQAESGAYERNVKESRLPILRIKMDIALLTVITEIELLNQGTPPSLSNDGFTAHALMLELQGTLTAMLRQRNGNIKRGANGRKLIGAASRERVRRAADELRTHRKLSKEEAAPLIADKAGLSPATVRKMLTAMFPGTDWTADND